METENRNEIPSLHDSPGQSYTEEPQHINPKLSRRLLVGLIRFAALLYQTFVLLGLHRFYLRGFSSTPEDIPSDDKITELPSAISPAPYFESMGWERTCAILRSVHRKYMPVVVNGSAFYHLITSITTSDVTQEPLTGTIGIIAVITCANAIILSTYFLHYAPAFNLYNDLDSTFDESIGRDSNNTIIDRRTQAAMLMSVPSASTFWALASVVVYYCSSFAMSKFAITVISSSSGSASTPWWFAALIYTTLILCIIHFFGIVLWSGYLEGSVGDHTFVHLPLPCTFPGPRASSPFSFTLSQKRTPSISSTVRKSHRTETNDSEIIVVAPSRTNTQSTQWQSDDDTRRSRKGTSSSSPYPRTPSPSPRPTKKRQGKKSSKSSVCDTQGEMIVAPQVIKCSSSSTSTPPFPCSFRH